MRGVVAVLALILLAGGCRTLSGRTADQWLDDRTITARVKTRLAATGMATLTRVHVDTYNRVAYLTGGVETAAEKERAERVARAVPSVDLVVSNLHVVDETEAPAASPATGAGDPGWPAPLSGMRLELETGTPAWTRYAAYDAHGRRMATVYTVAPAELSRGVPDLAADGRAVERVAVYPGTAQRSYVVLWHVERDAYTR